ncbi:hypothetical protein [Paenisporosarcina sp. TG20]|uniref:hypothetical protein n=1 Tax=Paenisporosarcina sp. TG20 TaxID=1211706 RepID=UPI00036F04AE|nr:hypothetical protein [Paenisporosarcina sp. TG20]
MSKNNKKTLNERTHNSFGIYKSPNEPNEEFAAEFNSKSKPKNVVTKNTDQQSNKNK